MPSRNRLMLPVAVLIAAAIIGTSLWVARKADESKQVGQEEIADAPDFDSNKIPTIQADDHVFGNPNAPLVLVVYSDFQCPFCREFHDTMHNIVNLFGEEGQVAWVYRHFPLVSLHPEAPMYALASECVADLGGNQAFWDFADDLFDDLEPGVVVDAQGLLDLADGVGVSRVEFASCMRSNELMERVEEDFDLMVEAGAVSTPYTVAISANGRTSFEGAQPFVALAAAVRSVTQGLTHEPLATPSSDRSFIDDFENLDVSDTDSPRSTSSHATSTAATSTTLLNPTP